MKASIIILNWNGNADECTEACQSALSQSYQNKEIIFVDNGSTNGSDLIIEKTFPELRIARTGKNLGVASGRNFGAHLATGDVLFFLENDGTWGSTGVVEDVIGLFNSDENLGVIYTKVVGYPDGALQSHECIDNSPPLVLVASFSGGACAIRRNLFTQCGNFPGDFFRQGEERFFTLLAYEAGYKVCYWKKHVLLHRGSSYAGKNTIVLRLNFEHEMKTVARLFPNESYLLLFWLKAIAWLPRFFRAGDLRYFISNFPKLLGWLNERKDFSHVSSQTLALTESITRGDFAFVPAEIANIQLIKQRFDRTTAVAVTWSNFLRWVKR